MERRSSILRLSTELATGCLELGDPVCLCRAIKAPSMTIWKAISQPGHLKLFHPFCQANEVYQWPGIGAQDSITYHSGLHFQRDFINWIEGIGYDLEIGPPPEKTARVVWRIKPLNKDCSEVMIEVTPYLQADLPESRKLAYQRRAFGKIVELYLDSVLKGIDHFVTSGQVVRKNQFGTHPVYSD